jgi:hypothetical protein
MPMERVVGQAAMKLGLLELKVTVSIGNTSLKQLLFSIPPPHVHARTTFTSYGG